MRIQPVRVVLWEMSKLAKGMILRSVVLPTALRQWDQGNAQTDAFKQMRKWNLKDQIYRLRHKWRGIFKKTETRVIHDIEIRRMSWALEQVVYSDAITKCPQYSNYMASWWKKTY